MAQLTLTLYGEAGREKKQQQQQQPHLARPSVQVSNSREQTMTTDFLLSRQGKWLDKLKRSFLETKTRQGLFFRRILLNTVPIRGLTKSSVVLACMVPIDIPDALQPPHLHQI
jgi:hypothetical protein